MDTGERNTLEALIEQALALRPEERRAFLERSCGADAALRAEADSLLAFQEEASRFFENLAGSIFPGGLNARLCDEGAPSLERSEERAPQCAGRLTGRVLSSYQVLEKCGGGGMGVVYKARDIQLHRLVALKVLPPHLSADEEARARFMQEARAASTLDHPNIAVVHEIGQAGPGGDPGQAGQLFIAMAYYEGETLKKKIARGALPLDEALGYAEQIAQGLARAHEAGIVHRDIKPANVMVTGRGRVKIVDFGLAKVQDVSLTKAGVMLGTVAYMSPEQARGEVVDLRTDLWSLGVVMYELLTGVRPFRGAQADAVIYAIRHEAPTPVRAVRPEVPEALAEVVERLLQKAPEERFQGAAEVLAALRASRRGDALARYARKAAAPRAQPRRARRRRVLAAGLSFLVVVLLGVGLALQKRPWTASAEQAVAGGMEDELSLAVLPLENLSGKPEQEYFADGITEELVTTLTKIENLRVIARRSVMRFKDSTQPVPEIAEALDVKYVVDGAVLQDGERVRITVSLIEAATATPVWSERFEQDLREVLRLQREVALAIVEEIEVALTLQDRLRLNEAPQVDPEAFGLYIKGTQARHRFSDEDFRQAAHYFERAIAADSGYAPAYAGLASTLFFSGGQMRAQRLAEKALELDPTLAEAYIVLGLLRQQWQWDWEGAEATFRMAIRLNPGYAEAHHELSMLLVRQGRFEEAQLEAQHTLYLAPMSVRYQHGLAEVLLFSGRYDEAIEAAREALALDSSYAVTYWSLGMVYTQQGRYDKAEAILKKGMPECEPLCSVELAYVYAVSGRRQKALSILERLEARWSKVLPHGIARIYVALGERGQALAYLERLVEERGGPNYLSIDPALVTLHSEPRFQALLKEMGLGK